MTGDISRIEAEMEMLDKSLEMLGPVLLLPPFWGSGTKYLRLRRRRNSALKCSWGYFDSRFDGVWISFGWISIVEVKVMGFSEFDFSHVAHIFYSTNSTMHGTEA